MNCSNFLADRLDTTELIFSYGTLQDRAVQLANFGRFMGSPPVPEIHALTYTADDTENGAATYIQIGRLCPK